MSLSQKPLPFVNVTLRMCIQATSAAGLDNLQKPQKHSRLENETPGEKFLTKQGPDLPICSSGLCAKYRTHIISDRECYSTVLLTKHTYNYVFDGF